MDSMHAYKYKILDDGIYKYDWIKENKRNTRIFKLQKQPRIHLSMVGKKIKQKIHTDICTNTYKTIHNIWLYCVSSFSIQSSLI